MNKNIRTFGAPLLAAPLLLMNASNVAAQPRLEVTDTQLLLSFTATGIAGTPLDWWLALIGGNTIAYLDSDFTWKTAPDLAGLRPGAQINAATFANVPITRPSGLPAGNYHAYFGVDFNQNGVLDFDTLVFEGLPMTLDTSYAVADTGQSSCYDESGIEGCPAASSALYGQDAQYAGNQPHYADNGDGTVTDQVTGLMWQKSPDTVDAATKLTLTQARANAGTLTLGGYTDWRVPTIKELYSLMDFRGVTGTDEASNTPYIDTAYFDVAYGDTAVGERFIDGQFLSDTEYVSTTMFGDATLFGVNFIDGRIKGYPSANRFYVRYVRGNTAYGENRFTDNGNSTVTDDATGLTWMQEDSGAFAYIALEGYRSDGSLTWSQALQFCEGLNYAGHDDWRLPNAKELHTLVDYSRSPETTGSAAIDPIFDTTVILDEGGGNNFPFYWTSTTHLDGVEKLGEAAVYIAFGEALGFMESPPNSGKYTLTDVHGAGAQRSDPKTGDPDDYPYGFGPQGDVRRIYNYARCVRGGT